MTIEVPVRFGDTRNCVGLSITGDREAEEDESFQVLIEELGVSTTVTIMDDGKSHVHIVSTVPPSSAH